MASLSNINGIFDVHSTGAILFSTSHGTSGQILKSNGNAAPTWIPQSDIVGDYLPLSGGTLTGATATASGISFTVGGTLTGTTATFSANVGIGETNPTYKFEVRGSGTNTLQRWTTTEGGALLLIPANDAANPDWTFIAGTNEDIQIDPANNDSGLIVKYNGNVGIGTASPTRPLHVIGKVAIANAVEASSTGALLFSCDSTSNKIYSRTVQNVTGSHPIDFIQTTTTVMRIDSSGNVILNQATSRIYGGGTATGRFFLGNSDSKSYMMINGSAHTNPNLIYFVNDAAVTLTLNADNSATFAGNVGIGVTSPNAKLTITGSGNPVGIGDEYGYTGIKFYGAQNGQLEIFNTRGNTSFGNIIFKAGSSESMRIQHGGNVGIGTTSPTLGKLQVAGSGYFGPIGTGHGTTKPTMQSNAVLRLKPHDNNSTNMNFASVNAGAGIGIQTTNGPGTANWDIALSPFGGNVGIGMVQPAAKLDVVGSVAAGTRDGGVGYKNQLFQCSKTATGSNVGIDVMHVGHTNALNITVMCIIDGAQAAVGVGTICVAYGNATGGLTSTRVSGNFVSVSVAYINSSGSENYILRVTPVYGGTSNPTIYLSAQGQSNTLLRTAV